VRIPSGVPGFDALVQGGLPDGAAVVVQGPSGHEKDAFLLQFVAEGLHRGGSALVVLSSMSPSRYLQELRSAGVNVDRAQAEGRLKFVDWFTYKEAPVQEVEEEGAVFRASIDLANVGIAISRAIAALPRGGEKRAALEILSPALGMYDLAAVYGFAQSTKAKLERFGFTSLLVLEKEMHEERTVSSIRQPFDGVVDFERARQGDEIVRKVAVLSLIRTATESKYVPVEVGTDGVVRLATAPVRERTLFQQEERIRSDPRNPKLWLETARNLHSMGDTLRALKCVEATLNLDADDQEAWRFKAEVLDALGRNDEADEARVRGRVAVGPAVVRGPPKGDGSGRILGLLEERLRSDARDPDALFALAAVLTKANDLLGAVAILDTLAEIDETYPGLWTLKTQLHARRGELEKAQESRARRLAVESGVHRRPLEPTEPASAPQAASFCPSCGSVVGDEEAVCPSCGVLFDDTGEPVTAPQARPKPEKVAETLASKKADSEPTEPPAPRPAIHPAGPEDDGRGLKGKEPRLLHRREPRRTGLTNGLTKEPARAPGRTNGLVNGIRGQANGLTNGMRGRTNGLVNGTRPARSGRTNGLVNGIRGRTNGLVNGIRGRTNGLVNGIRGRTNGLVNGFRSHPGITNGLTNGMGLTNGLGSGRLGREIKLAKWKVYLIPIAVAVLLLIPILGPETGGSSGIMIDGDFSDWEGVRTLAMQSGANADIDITGVALLAEERALSLLVQVRGRMLAGEPVPGASTDQVFVFVDLDMDPATGYPIRGIGADRLLVMRGQSGVVSEAMAYRASLDGDPRDWRTWADPATIAAATAGDRMEIGVDWLLLGNAQTSAAFLVATMGWDGSTDLADVNVAPGSAPVRVAQRPIAPVSLSGANAPLLALEISAMDRPVGIQGVTVELLGTAPLSAISGITLTDGLGVPLAQRSAVSRQVRFSFPLVTVPSGSTVSWTVTAAISGVGQQTLGALVPSADALEAVGAIVTLTVVPTADPLGYVGGPPSTTAIDGGYAEWTNAGTDGAGESTTRGRLSVDLDRFAVSTGPTSFAFYLRLHGPAFAGTVLPTEPGSFRPTMWNPDRDRDTVPDAVDPFPDDFDNDGVVDTLEGGDQDGDGIQDYTYGGPDLLLNTTIPATFPVPYAGRPVGVYIGPTSEPPAIGEDTLRIYVDTDNGTDTGYVFAGLGADVLVEIVGREGVIARAEILDYSGTAWDWSWTNRADILPTLGLVELEAEANVSSMGASFYVEMSAWGGAGDALGPATRGAETPARTATRGVPGEPQTLDISGNQKLYLRDTTHSTETACTTNRVASTTQGTTSVKTVTLSSGQSACWYADSTTGTTISAGDWETLLDVDTSVPKSAFKDGASVSVPTSSIGLLDSLGTTLPSKDNLIVAVIQFDKTNTGTSTISAGNLELRRGTSTSDPLISETQLDISLAANDAVGDGMFTVLIGKDASAPASPTYGVFGLASAATVNAEVKLVVINGLASANSVFADGTSTSIGTSCCTTLVTQSTSFPASDSSLPNIIVAAVQLRVTGTQADFNDDSPGPSGIEVRRDSTTLRGIQFQSQVRSAAPNGVFALFVAADTGAPANPSYSVRAWNADTGATNGEAKLLLFRGLAAQDRDTGSVALSTSRTVLTPDIDTTFPAGDDVLIGAIQLDSSSQRKYAAGGNDIRLQGAGSGSSNEFAHTIAAFDNGGADQWESFVQKVTTTTANPSYEGAATAPGTPANGELKLVAIHVNDTAADYDVRLEIWNLNTNDVAETIGTCLDRTTRGDDVRCLISSVAQKTISSTQVVRIRLVHSSSSGTVAFDYDDDVAEGDSRATIPPLYIPEFGQIVLPATVTILVPLVTRRLHRRKVKRGGVAA